MSGSWCWLFADMWISVCMFSSKSQVSVQSFCVLEAFAGVGSHVDHDMLIIHIHVVRIHSGIAMLTFALLMSARMGIFQETLYKKYGKHSKEALFYNVSFPPAPTAQEFTPQMFSWSCFKMCNPLTWFLCIFLQHCLPLPGFLLLSTNIYNHCVLFSQSSECRQFILGVFFRVRVSSQVSMITFFAAPTLIPGVELTVPIMWIYLLINVITQYPTKTSTFAVCLYCFSLFLLNTISQFITCFFPPAAKNRNCNLSLLLFY